MKVDPSAIAVKLDIRCEPSMMEGEGQTWDITRNEMCLVRDEEFEDICKGVLTVTDHGRSPG